MQLFKNTKQEKTSKTTYFLSGLGADERTFVNLNLHIGENHYIPWHPPVYEQSLRSYAQELIDQHIDTSKEFRLIGLSFGGLVAQEIADLLNMHDIVLISSMRNRKELPKKFKFLSKMPFYDALMNPQKGIEIGVKNRRKQFAIETEEGMELAEKILQDTDPHFFKWAVKQIMNWESPNPKNHYPQIIGTNDPLFPFKLIQNPTHVIKGAGHFMIYERADEISEILNAYLEDSFTCKSS